MRFNIKIAQCVLVFSFVFALSSVVMRGAKAAEFGDKGEAAKAANALLGIKAKVASGDYVAAMTLADVYATGISYEEENFISIPNGEGAGTHRVYLVKPDPRQLRNLLEGLSAKGDLWSALQLAGFYSRPVKVFWAAGFSGEIILRRDTENDWVTSVFPANPGLAKTLYAKVAAPAAEIIRGNARAVYAGGSAVPTGQQQQYLLQEHGAVADALEQLAGTNANGSGANAQDWHLAYEEYRQLADLIEVDSADSNFLTQYQRFPSVREDALSNGAALLVKGGHGLVANCPVALAQLTAHAKVFPEKMERNLSSTERGQIFGRLQSMIGLIYFNGCAGVPVDRDKAYAWLGHMNKGLVAEDYATKPYFDSHALTPDALVAWANLLDQGTSHHAPDKKAAFEAYWTASVSQNAPPKVLLRVAQMIEGGPQYTDIEVERAKIFYCRAAQRYREPEAINWLKAHPKVNCER